MYYWKRKSGLVITLGESSYIVQYKILASAFFVHTLHAYTRHAYRSYLALYIIMLLIACRSLTSTILSHAHLSLYICFTHIFALHSKRHAAVVYLSICMAKFFPCEYRTYVRTELYTHWPRVPLSRPIRRYGSAKMNEHYRQKPRSPTGYVPKGFRIASTHLLRCIITIILYLRGNV